MWYPMTHMWRQCDDIRTLMAWWWCSWRSTWVYRESGQSDGDTPPEGLLHGWSWTWQLFECIGWSWWHCQGTPSADESERKIVTSYRHCSDVILSAVASQITCVSIVYSTVCSDADQRKHQSFASLAFVRGIHRWPVNSPHKGPVTRKMFPFDDVVMILYWHSGRYPMMMLLHGNLSAILAIYEGIKR